MLYMHVQDLFKASTNEYYEVIFDGRNRAISRNFQPANCKRLPNEKRKLIPMMDDQRSKRTLTHRRKRFPNLPSSVDRTFDCRSHFWLKAGSIHWCK
ncbi:DUF6527 family protein [Paraburkholderia sp.]|uniref:DUF6527 family protein n=1 Tax=Paraburkholderia sp. TaxID=1926495 RepID=UPI00341C8E79